MERVVANTCFAELPIVATKRPAVNTKVWADVLEKARAVAGHRRVLLQDYLSEILAPVVQQDYVEYLREALAREESHKKK